MPLLRYHDGAFFATGLSTDAIRAVMSLQWRSHPDSTYANPLWMTRSPYLAAPFWDWVGDEATRQALGPFAWNYQTSFAKFPIAGTGVDSIRLPVDETPYPFQIAGVQRGLLRDRLLIADQPGCGKTVEALGVANMTRPRRTVIACPTFLTENWANECERWLVDPQPITILDRAKKSLGERGIVIVPYSRGHTFHAQLAAGPPIDLLIMDELHLLKSGSARRTAPWLGGNGLARAAKRAIGLTGTPTPNHPGELYGPLSVLAPELVRGVSAAQFADIYCATTEFKKKVTLKSGRDKQIEIKKIESKNELVLNAELRASGVMVRRLKNDVLEQLPPKNVYFVHMTPTAEIDALVREEADLYQQLEMRIVTSTELIALKGHIASVRARLGLLKAPKIAEYVQSIFDAGEDRVVLFMLHLAAIDAVARHFAAGDVVVHPLTGAESPLTRQNRVADFQKPGGRKLAIGQIRAAGLGLTMTAARWGVLGEISWTWDDNSQAIDRLHRVTQTRQVEAPVLTFPHAVEQRVVRANARKALSSRNVLDINLQRMINNGAAA
jgi:SWI/SNF-related matrix-associated actin-dependent regulator 1 of chromatin subfamily A